MKNKKRGSIFFNSSSGQAAIFMIVGLIVLLGGAVFFYSTSKVPKPYESEIKIVKEQVPIEFDPIRKYGNDCAYSIAIEGLKIIGKQGGYISFTDKNLNREEFKIAQNPTEGDAVLFSRDSDLKTAYWWYLKSANDCKGNCFFATKRPDLRQTENSIEKQLERFIDLKFKDCLKDFEPFAGQEYQITETGKVKSDVVIALDDITVLVEYPLNIQRQNTQSKITQFIAAVPVNLDKVYDLATKITNFEIKHHYLEKHILNLIAAFSGVSHDKLPPMSDMQFKFGSAMSWQKKDIRQKITDLLASYTSLFQVDGTYNYQRNIFNSELKQRLYDSTIIPVANSSFKDLSASFSYLDAWPMYFNLNCKGERCIPASANSLISFFGIQEYKFAYDMSFPVFVEIQDPFAFNGQGYSFNLFLEGNVRRNKPMAADFDTLAGAALSERSLLCDSRTSGNVTVNVLNAANRKPVSDAQILYTNTDESCFIDATNSNGAVKQQFPVGVGGVVSVVKDDYIGKSVEFDPRINKDDSLNVELQPIYTKRLVIRKKNVAKTSQGWQFSNVPVDLNGKESVSVALTRLNEEGELDFSSIASYDGLQKDSSELQIAPGAYTAEASLILNDRIIIPERQKCVKKGIFGEKECYTIPKIDFGEKSTPGQEKYPEGGLKLNITINPTDLENHGTIVLYVVSSDIASVPEQERAIEDIDQISKAEEYSGTYKLALQPTFE